MNTETTDAKAERNAGSQSAETMESDHPIDDLRKRLKEWEDARRVAAGIADRAAELKREIEETADKALSYEPDSLQEIGAAEKICGLNSRLGLMADRAGIAADEAREKAEETVTAGRFALLALERAAWEVRAQVREKVGALVSSVWPHYRPDGAGRMLVSEAGAVIHVEGLTSLPGVERLVSPEDCRRLLDCAARIDQARVFIDGLRFTVRGL